MSHAAPPDPSTAAGAERLAALPPLVPAPPAAGQRIATAALPGSADALAIAQLASASAPAGRLVVVLCADALAAQRIVDEVAWFAPGLSIALLPDWETLPYDHFSPHQDLVSERLATLYRVTRGDCDVLVVAATTALYRLAPAFVPGRVHVLPQAGHTARRRCAALAAFAGRLPARHPGRLAGGVQHPRRADRPLPDGQPAAVPARPLRRRCREHQGLRRGLAAHALPGARSAPVARARVPARRRRAHAFPQPLPRGFRGRSVEVRAVQGRQQRCLPGGIEYYLPLFFDATATLADYLPASAIVVSAGDVQQATERFWQDTDARYRLLRGDEARPLLPPAEVFLPVDAFNGALKAFPRIDLPVAADGGAGGARRPAAGAAGGAHRPPG